MVLFSIILMISAIFCVNVIGHNAAEYGHDAEAVERYFGAVVVSMDTLFQFLTLDDWGTVARVVTDHRPEMMIFFVIYILVTSFTILSLLTGLVAENMLKVASEENDEIEKERREAELEFLNKMKVLFEAADVDRSNTVSKAEFVQCLAIPANQGELRKLDIDLDDMELEQVFDECLDEEGGTGEVTMDHFLSVFKHMRGLATQKDVMKLEYALRKLESQLQKQNGFSEESSDAKEFGPEFVHNLDDLTKEVQMLTKKVDDMQWQMSALGRHILFKDSAFQEAEPGGDPSPR